MPTLYIVATPIGNLEDISFRALNVLREVKLIAAEDTRKTRKLLNHYNIKTPMTSYYEHNKLVKLDYIMDFLSEGDVALVSEAGTPGISDPGYELIAATGKKGIPVVPIPGPSAVVTALTVSGLATDRFSYLGFLPRRAGSRKRLLESVVSDPGTLVVLEAPHRLRTTLQAMLDILGNRRITVCRELTKVHEEIYRGTINQAIEHFTEPRGEFTLVIEGNTKDSQSAITEEIEKRLKEMRFSGITAREALSKISEETGISRRELYRTWLKND